MKNDFISMIKTISDVNTVSDEINAREVFLTLINGFLYVRPGENTRAFYRKFRSCFKDGQALGEQMYHRRNKHIPYTKCVRTMTALAVMNCIKESFDSEYFNYMVECVDISSITRKKRSNFALDANQREDLFRIIRDFDSYANDSFVKQITNIIYYADASTAYTYASIIRELENALFADLFSRSSLMINIIDGKEAC